MLQEDTGRCITCSRVCEQCGQPVRAAQSRLCGVCRRKAERLADQQPCPRCGKPGYLREATGWCGHCSRPRQDKQPPRTCRECGQLRRHAGLGLCSACWQKHPGRPSGWVCFFAALVLLAGFVIVLVGGAMSIGVRDLVGRRKWAGYTIGPVIITIGIAVVALGVWLW
ncbi:hypothetical protein [Streptomyces sp. NPDC003480]